MKHELVQARNATGMKLTGQNSMLCGYYRGFAIVTNLNSKARCYDVVVWAGRPGADMTAEANQWIAGYAAQHPVCIGGGYSGQALTAQIAMDKKRDVTAQSLLAYYNDVTGWLAANGMVSGCGSCGAASGTASGSTPAAAPGGGPTGPRPTTPSPRSSPCSPSPWRAWRRA